MITAAVQQPFEKRAIGLSIALHCCALAALALLPFAPANVGSVDLRAVNCGRLCAPSLTLTIEHRFAPAVAHAVAVPPAVKEPAATARRPVETGKTLVRAGLKPAAAAPVRGSAFGASVSQAVAAPAPVLAAPDPTAAPAATSAPTVAPAAAEAPARVAAMGPANWGSKFEVPVLRDRGLLDEVGMRIGRRGLVTVRVDDAGRAIEVRISAPGLDPAALEELRRRLLAAQYLPVERDGIAFDGTLQIHGVTASSSQGR